MNALGGVSNEPGPWICRSMRGQDGKRHSKANLGFVFKCRSVCPAEASAIYLTMEVAASYTNPSAKYLSILIELTPLNHSSPLRNVGIT